MKEMNQIRTTFLNPRNLIVSAIVLVIVIAVFREWWDDSDELIGQSELLQTRPAGCEYFYVPAEYTEIVFMTDPVTGSMRGTIRMLCVTIDKPDNIIKRVHKHLDQHGWKPLDYLFRDSVHGLGWHTLKRDEGRRILHMWDKCWIDDNDNIIETSIASKQEVKGNMIQLTLSMCHFDYAVWRELIDLRKNEIESKNASAKESTTQDQDE